MAGGLALLAAACGSSSKKATPATTVPSGGGSVAASDTITAIPALAGIGTSVTLDPNTAKALTGLGVSLAPFGSATFDSATSTVTFPITSGYAEIHSDTAHQPGYIEGSIQHFGSGLKLSAAGKVLTVTDFVVDPGNSMLYASVGGKPDFPLLFLDGGNVKVSMAGGNVVLDGTVAKLTQQAAAAVDSTFGTTAVTAGLALGTVHLVARPDGSLPNSPTGGVATSTDKVTEISRLTGESTSVALNANTAKALTGLGVSVAPNGTATFDSSTSTASFPITGGMVDIHSDTAYKPGYIAGVVIHQGSGLTFKKGATSVEVTNFVVDPGDSMLYATVGTNPGVPLLFLDGSNVKVSVQNGHPTLDGTVAQLTATAASALNQAFGTTALTAGIPLGTVHLVAAGS